jgi:hypothetical protein
MADGEGDMDYTRMWHLMPVIGTAVLLASCQIDSTAPMRAFDIKNVVQTGVPVAVNASISAVFASKSWCQSIQRELNNVRQDTSHRQQ